MNKTLLIDSRMRDFEKEYLKEMGYDLVLIPNSKNVYYEISSHVDIFCSKVENKLFFEPSLYEYIITNSLIKEKDNILCGKENVSAKYPFDIPYNVCQIGKNVIHNFKYTDEIINQYIKKEKLNKININQGYANCSIAVISDTSAIVTDKKIADILRKEKIDVLLIDEENNQNIKLYNEDGSYSLMHGFIGGCIVRIENIVIVFGDINNFKNSDKIIDFVKKQNLEIIDFKHKDIIDYGGIIKI